MKIPGNLAVKVKVHAKLQTSNFRHLTYSMVRSERELVRSFSPGPASTPAGGCGAKKKGRKVCDCPWLKA